MHEGPPKTPPHYDDFTEPEDGTQNDAQASAAWLLDLLVGVATHDPNWLIDDDSGRMVELKALSHEKQRSGVVSLRYGTMDIRLGFAVDASGYVCVTAELAAVEVFRGYIDRPYEELDIWPAGAEFAPRRTEEAPGRMGKRLTWLVLDGKVWPAIAPIANEAGFLLARVPDQGTATKR